MRTNKMTEKKLIKTVRYDNILLNWYYDGEQIYLESEGLTPEEIKIIIEETLNEELSPPMCYFVNREKVQSLELPSRIGNGESNVIHSAMVFRDHKPTDKEVIYESYPEPDKETLKEFEEAMKVREDLISKGFIPD